MVLEEFEDFGLESGGYECFGRRCLNCGAIVDPVIAAHRHITSSVVTSIQALTTRHPTLVSLTTPSKAVRKMNVSVSQNMLHRLTR